MTSELTHFDPNGRPRMVDVSAKAETERSAVASARVQMNRSAFEAVLARRSKKGDPCATAELAGIMAAKKTADLIPLCHPIALTSVIVETHTDESDSTVRLVATVKTSGKTGVEMEAMTAAAVSALTLYDMLKSVDREMTIEAVRLERKSGGKSGEFTRTD